MGMTDDVRGWMNRQKAPVTVGIIVSLIVSALLLWFMQMRGAESLAFDDRWLSHPWSIFTYPWVFMPLASASGLIFLAFFVFWLSWIGGSVEREMGSQRFALYMLGMTIAPALFLWIGAKVANDSVSLSGPWMPEAALTVTWCTRNPRAIINIWCIFPLAARWLGWLVAAGVLFSFGFGNPLLGVFACGHLALAYAFAANRTPTSFQGGPRRRPQEPTMRGGVKYDEAYYDEVLRRERERDERERLRKLFEDSLKDDK